MNSLVKDFDEFVKGHYDHRTWSYEIPAHEWDNFIKKMRVYKLELNIKPHIHYDCSTSVPNLSFIYNKDDR